MKKGIDAMKLRMATLFLVCLASCASQGHETRLDAARWVDLTHSFDEETIYWPNNPFGFELAVQFQ
ncbi:MAG: hypothetical protein ACK57N_12330, partial [Planctomycetia bacterium]